MKNGSTSGNATITSLFLSCFNIIKNRQITRHRCAFVMGKIGTDYTRSGRCMFIKVEDVISSYHGNN